MRTMPIEEFQEHCMEILKELRASHETILLTEGGEVIAEVQPKGGKPIKTYGDLFGYLRGQATIVGDLVEPIVPEEDWSDDIDPA